MEELKLIYILELGENWEGLNTYEFLFSDDTEGVLNNSGDWAWDVVPASGNPIKPEIEYVSAVGRIQTDRPFELIQNSDTFCVWDAVDGVTSIAWEDLSEYDEYPEYRLFFFYGDTMKEVKDKLYKVDINLEYNETRKRV